MYSSSRYKCRLYSDAFRRTVKLLTTGVGMMGTSTTRPLHSSIILAYDLPDASCPEEQVVRDTLPVQQDFVDVDVVVTKEVMVEVEMTGRLRTTPDRMRPEKSLSS